jgi:hypothetical protein
MDRRHAGEEDGGEHDVKASDRMLAAVWTIIVADLVMSLDNVMGVAAAAKGDVPLIVFGLVVSIPIVVLGSQIVMRLLARFPLLVLAGGGLLGYIAGEMMVEDPACAAWSLARMQAMHSRGGGRCARSCGGLGSHPPSPKGSQDVMLPGSHLAVRLASRAVARTALALPPGPA